MSFSSDIYYVKKPVIAHRFRSTNPIADLHRMQSQAGRRGREENDMQVVDTIVERREYGSMFMKCRKFKVGISDISFYAGK